MSSLETTTPNIGVANTLHNLLGFGTTSPFPFAGPTCLRLRRMREQRAKDRQAALTATAPAKIAVSASA